MSCFNKLCQNSPVDDCSKNRDNGLVWQRFSVDVVCEEVNTSTGEDFVMESSLLNTVGNAATRHVWKIFNAVYSL